jgi:DNA-binding MarR family transcriptional regulator
MFMRSPNEQHDPLEPASYREFQLLTEVDGTPDVTQRQLARRVGMALGLTNVLLRNMTQKGYVRVSHATWRRRLYTLTPEGLSHRIRLMVAYIQRVLDHYRRVRQTLREQLAPLALNRESRIAVYGTGEFAELVYLGLRELGIEEIDFFDSNKADRHRFLGMPVLDVATLQTEYYDRVVVASLGRSDAFRERLSERGVTPEQVVTFFADGRAREGLG